MESCPRKAAHMTAVSPSLHKKPQARNKRQSARRSINNMTQVNSCIKGALLVHSIHVSMVLKEQEDSGIMLILCCPCERSFAVPANKKPQASDIRQSTRHSINNMTRDDSCIKGTLLVRCIHVSVVQKEQTQQGRIVS